jgi:hypothetical protein
MAKIIWSEEAINVTLYSFNISRVDFYAKSTLPYSKLTLRYCAITKGYFGLMVQGCFLLIIKNNLH